MKQKSKIIICMLLVTAALAACGSKPAEASPKETKKVKESVAESEEEDRSKEQEAAKEKEQEAKQQEEKQEAAEETEPEETEERYVPGSEPGNAALIPLGKKITGTMVGLEDKDAWYAFTTGETLNSTYNITFLVTTANGGFSGDLYDESINSLESESVKSDGKAYTISTDKLEPNKTYYLCLDPAYNAGTFEYVVIVRNLNETYSIEEEENPDEEGNVQDGEIIPGNNQYDAALIPLGTKVFGCVSKKNPNAWFAFTTGENAGSTYNVTFVNESRDVHPLFGALYDEYGTEIDSKWVYDDGKAVTISTDQLDVNMTYYIRVYPKNDSTVDYSVIVKDPDNETTACKTAGSFAEARGALQNEEVYAGTNQNDSTLIPLGRKVSGTISENDSIAWFAFTTGETRGITYKVTYTYSSVDGGYRYFALLDEYGTSVNSGGSNADGKENTISTNQLDTNTTYYIQFETKGGEVCDYSLVIEAPDEKTPLKFEDPLVFEVPFEINETQIKFVINKAEFINKEKAKEELKPVAEAILEHPEHSILIAGTTATDGTQESCVDLSNRRAQAVKDLLVNTYKVPESQLQIVGLGYERDPFERGKDRDSNGKFVESEGRKNRRVVILDIDDPIAQEILRN